MGSGTRVMTVVLAELVAGAAWAAGNGTSSAGCKARLFVEEILLNP